MTVYADVVFAVNTAVNYLLLLLGARLTGFPARPLRALFGAVLGGAYAVCVLVPTLNALNAWWAKAMCFLVMGIVAYGIRKKSLQTAFAALLCGGALAGFVFLLTQVFSVRIVAFGGHIYYPLAAKVLILMAGGFYLAAALLMAGSMKHKTGELVPLRLCCGNRHVFVKALFDTGNSLTDPISGKPVVVLEWQRGAELLGVCGKKEQFLNPVAGLTELKEAVPKNNLRLVPYRCVGQEKGMLLAMPCRVKPGKMREVSALVALSPTPVSDGGGYEALIGGTLL